MAIRHRHGGTAVVTGIVTGDAAAGKTGDIAAGDDTVVSLICPVLGGSIAQEGKAVALTHLCGSGLPLQCSSLPRHCSA